MRPPKSPLRTARHLFSITAGALFLLAGIASSAMADDVPLNSSQVAASTANPVLVRTSQTPKKVELNLPIAMGSTVCVEYGEVQRSGVDGSHCGYHAEVRYECREEGRVCSRDPRGREHCTTHRECANRVVNVANYCTWTETVCVRHEVETSSETRKVMLKFKNMVDLAPGETETFQLNGEQTHVDGTDAVFQLQALQVKRPVKIKARDGVFTGFADVITIKGE